MDNANGCNLDCKCPLKPMKSKTIVIFTFCLIGSTVVSCINGTCDPVPPHFEIKGIESFNMRYTNSGLNPWETLAENESIIWSNYFTRFGFEMNFIAELPWNFGGAVLATSCDEPGGAGDKIGVDTVIVRTAFDYNENYMAGSVINEIILTNTWTFRTEDFDKFLPLEAYISENSEGVRSQTFELKLTEEPSTTRNFAFDISYKLNNGEEFRHQTATVLLTK